MPDDFQFRLVSPIRALDNVAQEFGHFRNHVGQVFANGLFQSRFQQFRSGPVGQVDAALVVETDDPGGNAGQNRFREAPPFIKFTVGFDQSMLLGFDFTGHAVKGPAQGADLIGTAGGVDANF